MKNTLYALTFALVLLVTPSLAKAHDGMACTMQYAPVCGTEKGIYKTYGNGCTLGASDAVYQHEGECTASEIAGKQDGVYVPPAHCTAWNDGCNSCGRSADGQSFCTLMACMGEPRAGYCTAYKETASDPAPPAPNQPVSSTVTAGETVGSTASDPLLSADATTTATTSIEKDPGFLFGIWHSIMAWFKALFS